MCQKKYVSPHPQIVIYTIRHTHTCKKNSRTKHAKQILSVTESYMVLVLYRQKEVSVSVKLQFCVCILFIFLDNEALDRRTKIMLLPNGQGHKTEHKLFLKKGLSCIIEI